jgi:hypothetical protein
MFLAQNMDIDINKQCYHKLEAQWTEPVSLTFHCALMKLNTEPSIALLPTKFWFIWLSSYREEDF